MPRHFSPSVLGSSADRGVLTAESPHNAQATLGLFQLRRQNVRANSLLHCLGCLHLLEKVWGQYPSEQKGRGEGKTEGRERHMCVCESGGNDMC